MRRKYIEYTSLGIIVILLLLTIWGVVIEPRLVDFKYETAVIPNLPTVLGKQARCADRRFVNRNVVRQRRHGYENRQQPLSKSIPPPF